MKVIGFDPGYGRLGISVLERANGRDTVVHSECFETPVCDEAHTRLGMISSHVQQLIEKHQPEAMALETLFFNANVKTAIRVAEVRGILLLCAAQARLGVTELGPSEIKLAVTGYGKSKKADVTKMVRMLFPELTKKTCLDDEYDAIAVGITALVKNSSKIDRLQKNHALLQQ